MKVLYIGLQHVTAYTERQTLDLQQIPAGMVAIMGENGSGKTTLMEAPYGAWFREFQSREKNITDYATSEDGALVVGFEDAAGDTFEARLSIDGTRRKVAAVLSKNGQPITDGKTPSYDAAIRALLPPPELLLATVFAAQNRRGSFITADTAERMTLLSALLGLDRYARLEARSRGWARAAQDAAATVAGRIQAIGHLVDDERMRGLAEEGAALDAERDALQRAADAVRARLADADARLAQHRADHEAFVPAQGDVMTCAQVAHEARFAAEQLSNRISRHDTDTETARGRLIDQHRKALAQIEDDIRNRDAIAAELVSAEEAVAEERAELQRRIGVLRADVERAGEIRAAVDRRAAITTQRGALERVREYAREQRDGLAETIRGYRDQLAEASRAQEYADALTRQSILITDVPCHAEGIYATCPLLADAVRARDEAARLRANTVDVDAITAAKHAAIDIADANDRQLYEASDVIAALDMESEQLAPVAAMAGSLEMAEAQIAGLGAQLEGLGARLSRERAAAKARESRRQSALKERLTLTAADHLEAVTRFDAEAFERRQQLIADRDEARRSQADADTTLATVTARRDDAHAGHTAYVAADVDKRAILIQDASAQQDLAVAQSQATDLSRRLAEVATLRAEWMAARQRHRALQQETATALQFVACFSRDGLPLLEIDAAGPAVSALTNELLEAALGERRFTVDLITQRARATKSKAGETMKDTLDLLILDAEQGGAPRSLSDLSGGEQVLVDEALKGAIALYMNQKNPSPFRTCFRDETTGPLSEANTTRYLSMLRRIHEIGGFHHTLFISQNPDAALLADARVRITKGQIAIVA